MAAPSALNSFPGGVLGSVTFGGSAIGLVKSVQLRRTAQSVPIYAEEFGREIVDLLWNGAIYRLGLALRGWDAAAIAAVFPNTTPITASAVIASAGQTLTFADANPDTIARSTGSFVTDGYVAGDTILVTGTASNDGAYVVAVVAALTLTLVAADSLTGEGPLSSGEVVKPTARVRYPGASLAGRLRSSDSAALVFTPNESSGAHPSITFDSAIPEAAQDLEVEYGRGREHLLLVSFLALRDSATPTGSVTWGP